MSAAGKFVWAKKSQGATTRVMKVERDGQTMYYEVLMEEDTQVVETASAAVRPDEPAQTTWDGVEKWIHLGSKCRKLKAMGEKDGEVLLYLDMKTTWRAKIVREVSDPREAVQAE